MSKEYRLVLCTCPDGGSAETLAHGLVSERLAGCVNILPGISSVYSWQGNIETGKEYLLLIKTDTNVLPELEIYLRNKHPYELPEIIAIPIREGSSDYLQWLSAWIKS
jgi:periplasmic divalent cation tolerance protein